jgi:DNA-binding transcriptional regulator YhcF (GntR family)
VYTQYIDMHSSILISQTDSRPLYVQIVEQVKQHVTVGEWVAGQEIPSIRQLAADLCVSVITVKRAYLELERGGVIVTQHGRGSIIAPSAIVNSCLHEEELTEHLERAVQLGQLLRLSSEDLVTRLEETCKRFMDDRPHKETR